MTILTLVRHGTTEWMEKKKLHGVTDSPLSLRGKDEAASTARFLSTRHFDAFYTSPLGRAVETAEMISASLGIPPKKLEGLKERNFGAMEGRTNFSSMNLPVFIKPVYLAYMAGIITFTGEKRADFKKRLFETACYIAEEHPNQNVLAVVHASVKSHLIAVLVDKKPDSWKKYNNALPCSITEIELSPNGTGRLISFNVHEHMLTTL